MGHALSSRRGGEYKGIMILGDAKPSWMLFFVGGGCDYCCCYWFEGKLSLVIDLSLELDDFLCRLDVFWLN